MKKFGARYAYLDEAPGAAGGGAAAGAGTAATGAAGGTAGTGAQEPGGTAGAGTGADAGGAAAGGTSTALSTAGGPEWTPATVPEKYRVLGDDGQLDITATFRKVDEARGSLEKRLGDGSARPKTADEYKIPETDTFKNLQLDDKLTSQFKAKAHDMGLSQGQYEKVMTEWATLAPALVEAGHKQTTEATVETLKGVFKDDFSTSMQGAYRAISTVAQKAGIDFAEVEAAIGNNPVAIRMFAALSKEMGEDKTPPAAAGSPGGGAMTREQYVSENFEAYSNERHPKHAVVTAQAKALADRESRGSPAL